MKHIRFLISALLIALLLITTASATDLFNATPFKGGVANGIMNGTGSTSTTGWVGDEKYSWYATRVATTGSVNFNTTSAANGTQSLDITITDATGHFVVNNTPDVTLPSLSKYAIPVSPNTAMNVYAYVKTSNAQGTGAYISTTQFSSTGVAGTVSTSSKLTGTNGYTKIGYTVTTDSNAAYMVVMLDHAAGAAQIINFDSVTVETATSDNYTGAGGRVYPIVNDSTSINNIDQSADTGGAYANTYTCPSGVVESAANEIAITTTKSQITQIGVWVVNKGTGDMGVEFHDASNKSIVSYNLTTAQLSNGAFNFFPSPAVVSPGTYHVHVLSATSDATVKTNTASDLSTASFEEEYAKNTEEINTCVNNVCMNLTSNGSVVGDPFGIPPNTTVDTYRGYYNASSNLTFANRQISSSDILALSSVYDIQPQLGNTEPSALKGWSVGAPLLGRGYLASGTTSDPVNVTWKYNTMLPVHTVDVSFIYYGFAGLSAELSGDGNTWSDTTALSSTAGWQTTTIHSSQYDKNTTVYVRIKKDTTTSSLAWTAIYFNATLNTTTTNLTSLPYVTGNNYVNVSSNGRAASSSLDPSLQANVWFYKVASPTITASFSSVNITPATNSTSYGWEGFAPFTMQFTSTSTGSPTSYVWNYTKLGSTTPVTFNQSTFSSPIYTFVSSGNYSIQLNATNIYASNQSIQTTWVNVTTPAPTSYFTANVSSGPTPLPVLFTDLSPGYPDTWNWSVDEGTGLQWFNLTDPLSHDLTYTFVPVRSSRVNLTVANISTMSDYSTSSMNITVTNQPPVASFVKNNTYGTTGTVFQFNDTSTGNNIYAWNWSFGDGNVSSSRNVTHQFPLGTYNVNLTVTNDGGSSTSIQTVYVSAFTSSYTANSTFGVVPMAVLFTETSTGLLPDSYYWEFGDGGTDTVQNPTHIYNAIGTFTVSHRITNGTSISWVNTTNMIKTEIANISASFTVSNSSTTTAPLVVRFTDTSTLVNATPATYYWVLGDGSTSTDQNPLHSYTNFGVYYANLTVRNGSTSNTSTSTSLSVASPYPNNASHNFVLNQMYPTTIRVKDSNTLALIGGSQITDDAGLKTTLNNGVLSTSYSYGSHTFTVEATGYYTKTTSEFVTSNSTFTILLDPQNGGTQNVWWTPHVVQVTLMDAAYQTRLSDVNLSATYNQSSMPTEWLTQLYGIQNGPAGNMIDKSLVMGGITGSDGTITLTMLGSLKYDIYLNSVAYGLNNYHVSAYPSDSMLNIYVPISGSTLPTNGNSTYVYLNNTRLYITQPNISYVSMCIDYQDLSGTTSTVTELWWFGNNNSIFGSESIASPGTSLITKCKTLNNVKGVPVYWNYSAVTGI